MLTPFYQEVLSDPTASQLLSGPDGLKLFPGGEAAQGTEPPYATYQTVAGAPLNCLAGGSCADQPTIQVDVFARTYEGAATVYKALRRVAERVAYVSAFNVDERGSDSRLYRLSFDVEWTIVE